jgi:cytochrome c oxidase assembly factor CtaG
MSLRGSSVSGISLAVGLVVLAGAWLGPLRSLASQAFSAHMTMHLSVVAIAAPLIAFGIAGGRLDPVSRMRRLFAPIPASIADQHLGGALMLLVGGAVYLAGGLWLMAALVRTLAPAARERT